jgi:hypothetical protein
MNELKGATRAGMGACGGKTCPGLVLRLFQEEGVPLPQVTPLTRRPLFLEVPMGAFAGLAADGEPVAEPARTHATGAFQGGL